MVVLQATPVQVRVTVRRRRIRPALEVGTRRADGRVNIMLHVEEYTRVNSSPTQKAVSP